VKCIDPLIKDQGSRIKDQGIYYRISLLRDFDLGRHRLQFLYQVAASIIRVNKPKLVRW
jgi:hypothetical protein